MTEFTKLQGGVCAATGFRAAAVEAGLKRSGGPDLVLLVSDQPASAAATFTTHRAAAAPVLVSRPRVVAGTARAVVVNSGCANAVTGAQGMRDAVQMAALAARATGVAEDQMLVCSTGKIGSLLPMDRVASGIEKAAGGLGSGPEIDQQVAEAILTTDTRPKRAALAHPDGWTVGGMAKGAGMIAPDMATMLAFVTTDARVPLPQLQVALAGAVEVSFNAITVDGEPSTNDTVVVFANGASGVQPTEAEFAEALEAVCAQLAEAIVADGEGATKFVTVTVRGAASADDARRAARSIAESPLVKCALYGADANWGRIAAALGKVDIALDLDRASIWMGGVLLFEAGKASGDWAVEQAHLQLLADEVEISCDLGLGDGQARMLTTDLSPGYVEINADYEP